MGCLLVLAMVAAMSVPGPARAQAPTPATSEAGERSRQGLAAPVVDRDTLAIRWQDVLESTPEAGDAALRTLLRSMQEAGEPQQPAFAEARLQQAWAAWGEGHLTRVHPLLQQARRLGPWDVRVAWSETVLGLRERPLQLQAWSPALVRTVRLAWTSPAWTLAWREGWVAWSAGAAGVFALLWMCAGLWRVLPGASYDLRLALGRLPTWWQAHVMLLCGLGTLALGAGWLTALLPAVALVAMYARPLQVPGLVVALVASTWALAPLPPSRVSWTDVELVSRAPVEPCDAFCEQRLRRMHDDGLATATLALAWQRWRTGTTSALQQADALLDGMATSTSIEPWRSLLRGHIAQTRGLLPQADDHYRAAFAPGVHPALTTAAAIGLLRITRLQQDRERSQQLAPMVARAETWGLEPWVQESARTQHMALPSVPLPASLVLDEATGGAWSGAWWAWQPWTVPPVVPIWASALLGLLLGVALRRLGLQSRPCVVCRTPTHPRVLQDAHLQGLCVWCLQEKDTTLRMSFAERHAREHRSWGRIRRMQAALWLSVVLAPGLALLLHRRGQVWGLLALLPLSAGLAWWQTAPTSGLHWWHPPLEVPWHLGALPALVVSMLIALVGTLTLRHSLGKD
jgi:hypothetical protein